MSLAKNTAFSLCKSFSNSPSSLFTRSNVSRVSFSSATNRPLNQYGAADDVQKKEHVDMADKTKQGMEKAQERTEEMKDKAKEKSFEIKENVKDKTEEMMNKTEEMKENTKKKTNDMASKAADKAEEAKDKTKEKAYDMKEKTKDTAGSMAEKTKDTAGTVAEKAKETMKGAWDMAVDTTQKIKERVVGNNDDKSPTDEFMEDHHLGERSGKDGSGNEKARSLRMDVDAEAGDMKKPEKK